MNAWLETASGVRIPLHAICTIGRSAKNTLVLSDTAISRRHALIHAQAQQERWLVDLGSSNGIHLNGRRVTQPTRLRDHDRLEIVGNVFVFRQAPPGDQEQPQDKTTVLRRHQTKTLPLWLLLADIEKSTELSRSLPTDEFSQLVGGWILTSKELIDQHGGRINQYLGDGLLAYWPGEETSAASMATVLSEFKARRAAQPPAFRVAVHFGAVTLDRSVGGGEDRLVGPEVSFVFRMERLAATMERECLLSEPAVARLESLPGLAAVGQHMVSGFEGCHRFYSY